MVEENQAAAAADLWVSRIVVRVFNHKVSREMHKGHGGFFVREDDFGF